MLLSDFILPHFFKIKTIRFQTISIIHKIFPNLNTFYKKYKKIFLFSYLFVNKHKKPTLSLWTMPVFFVCILKSAVLPCSDYRYFFMSSVKASSSQFRATTKEASCAVANASNAFKNDSQCLLSLSPATLNRSSM